MTQLVSPSSRRSRYEHEARHQTGAARATHYSGLAPRGRHATPRGQGFDRVVGWTILGSVLPGVGLIAAGRRGLGRIIVTISVLLVLVLAGKALTVDRDELVKTLLSDPNQFLVAAGILLVIVICWIVVVITTHSAARRYSDLTSGQRVLSAALVTALIGTVAVPAAIAAQDAAIARDALLSIFSGSQPISKDARRPNAGQPDPWANVPRVNVLLMGGDSGLDRIGIRPDTMIVASIDTHSGETVLVSLPRNLERAPFPPDTPGAREYPNGFDCANANGENTECLLNGLWTWGDQHKDYYPGDKRPGLTATTQAIEMLTGLRIDQYVMLNLRGFADFIDAMGGLTINVRDRLPIGGSSEHPYATSWIEPGTQHLDGYHALWFARSRWSTSDFDRMRRQRCVIGAVVQQANPVALALNFGDLAASMKKNFLTSIPREDIDAWATLGQRVKTAKVRSLAFTNNVIDTTDPDVDKMRAMVDEAINPPPASTEPTPSASATPKKKKRGTPSTPTPTDSATAQDVAAVC